MILTVLTVATIVHQATHSRDALAHMSRGTVCTVCVSVFVFPPFPVLYKGIKVQTYFWLIIMYVHLHVCLDCVCVCVFVFPPGCESMN